jgi:hypothetical protein
VVSLAGEFKEVVLSGETSVTAGAGATLAQVCAFAKEHSLTGLEFAWGIPGAAGGAAYMNAGAYNNEMSSVLASCTHVTKAGEIGSLQGDELELGYRHSAYTDNGSTILFLTLNLEHGRQDQIQRTMDDLYERRKSKQPLEFFRNQTRVPHDSAHGVSINRVMSGDSDKPLSIRHDDMCLSLAEDGESSFLKGPDCSAMWHSGNLRHLLCRDLNLSHIGTGRSIRHCCKILADGVFDVVQGFFFGLSLRPTSWQRRTGDRITPVRLLQNDLVLHKSIL